MINFQREIDMRDALMYRTRGDDIYICMYELEMISERGNVLSLPLLI